MVQISLQNSKMVSQEVYSKFIADGELRRSGWQVDGGQLFSGCDDGASLAPAWTTAGALASASQPPLYLPALTTITYARRGAHGCCSPISFVARMPQEFC